MPAVGYSILRVSPPRSKKTDEAASAKDLVDRAERIAAMLDRWEAEEVSGEPEWNVDAVEPMTLRPESSQSKPET